LIASRRSSKGSATSRCPTERTAQDDRAAWKVLQMSQDGYPRYFEMNDRFYDGLRKAGLPKD
jgi:hypothetical protein